MNARSALNSKYLLISAALALIVAAPAHAVDDAGAQALLKDSKCLKCHSVDKKKDGPSYKEIAAKYKGKPDAVAKLTKHVTEPSKVEIDGVKEDHGSVKTRDPAKVSNLVQWILSR
jgi:cytochrome c